MLLRHYVPSCSFPVFITIMNRATLFFFLLCEPQILCGSLITRNGSHLFHINVPEIFFLSRIYVRFCFNINLAFVTTSFLKIFAHRWKESFAPIIVVHTGAQSLAPLRAALMAPCFEGTRQPSFWTCFFFAAVASYFVLEGLFHQWLCSVRIVIDHRLVGSVRYRTCFFGQINNSPG